MYEDAVLICEGECNPDIRDFDKMRNRIMDDLPLNVRDATRDKATILDWSRRLKHTPHIAVSNEVYEFGVGWCRRWTCAVCGHTRAF